MLQAKRTNSTKRTEPVCDLWIELTTGFTKVLALLSYTFALLSYTFTLLSYTFALLSYTFL